ncbi:MAG TPA: sigma-54 dependent transcriptional regulator [Gemmatimonadaceae bacterium]|nr:sigma-54 dependent transcriptional regulator [Gemmatimonadaceae bacterium]
MSRSILLVDDDPRILSSLGLHFEGRDWSVRCALDGRTGAELYEREAADLVITDLDMPGLTGMQLVELLRARDPDATVLVLTGHGDIETAVRALHAGAENFLTKPVDFAHLDAAAERAHEKARLRQRTRFLAAAGGPPLAALGQSPAMQALAQQINALALGTAPVLLGGETGTGKGWVAQQLHAVSPRAAEPFVEVNCAGLSAAFLDSELFGHERGAFTDAKQSRRGLFEVADRGTLFLDEIGDLAPELQPKLLKVLESQRFRRLGGSREIEVDVRLVAATHVDLREAVRTGRFREDLYYRLAVLPLHLPPLRERGPVEVADLAHRMLAELRARQARGPQRFTDEALDRLCRYPWPGNIRELRNVLERVLLLASDADAIRLVHLPPEVRGDDALAARLERSIPDDDFSLASAERRQIVRALAHFEGNRAQAARALGVTRATLYAKIKLYTLEPEPATRG